MLRLLFMYLLQLPGNNDTNVNISHNLDLI